MLQNLPKTEIVLEEPKSSILDEIIAETVAPQPKPEVKIVYIDWTEVIEWSNPKPPINKTLYWDTKIYWDNAYLESIGMRRIAWAQQISPQGYTIEYTNDGDILIQRGCLVHCQCGPCKSNDCSNCDIEKGRREELVKLSAGATVMEIDSISGMKVKEG
jgi:hypothetical protein